MSSTDPGNEPAIREAADKLEDSDDGSSDTTQYYFSSTLAPLLAGTFGPMASTFSICALVKNWRVYVPTGEGELNGVNLQDPSWLIALNALSLAFALIGNLALLLNMAKRLRFSIAQPITIGGFYVASVLLIADMAALTSSPTLHIDYVPAQSVENHSLTGAFYYAIFAAALYFIIASLMCCTVYGASKGYYEKSFNLTTSQRTLMLQTMSFFIYMLLGALVWHSIEGWDYLDAVYWANVTLLTIGLGDFVPATSLGQGLIFPFAVGGIVILGLVVGSIRTLVLERGTANIAAHIMEQRRSTAINHVNVGHNTIRIGWFAKATFIVEANMLPAQRREEEFRVMRAVQVLAERQRRYIALGFSAFVAVFLWFVGAAIFQQAEGSAQLNYLEWLFFSYTSLLTIGYGDPAPQSNSGRAFFVFWSLLAIPSLTILVSNMGDTVIKVISELTDFIGAITVLPGEHGFQATVKMMIKRIQPRLLPTNFVGPGAFGGFAPSTTEDDAPGISQGQKRLLDRLADRVSSQHFSPHEFEKESFADGIDTSDELDCDIAFYHYVLSREIRDVMRHLQDKPARKYSWVDWEYYIRLMGNLAADEDNTVLYPGQRIPNALVPGNLAIHPRKAQEPGQLRESTPSEQDDSIETTKLHLHGASEDELHLIHSTHTWSMPWSWLSDASPLLSLQSESEWIVQRLSAALERELNRTRRGFKRKPPISYCTLRRWVQRRKLKQSEKKSRAQQNDVDPDKKAQQLPDMNGVQGIVPEGQGPEERLENRLRDSLERAAMSEE